MMPTSIARVSPSFSPARASSMPAAVEGIATSFQFGNLVSTRRHGTSGEVYKFEKGSIQTQGGKVSSVTFGDDDAMPVPAEFARYAQEQKLGGYIDAEAGLGTESIYFQRGDLLFGIADRDFRGMDFGTAGDATFVPPEALSKARAKNWGLFMGAKYDDKTRTDTYYFQRGQMTVKERW
jgi:hypothetical protein